MMVFSEKPTRRLLRSSVALPLVFAPLSASAQSAAVEAALQDALRAAQQQRPDLSSALRTAANTARANSVIASTAAPSAAAAGGGGLSLSTLGYVAGGVLAAGAGVAGAVALGGGGGDDGGGDSSASGSSENFAFQKSFVPEGQDYAEAYIASGVAAAGAVADATGQVIAVLDGGVSDNSGVVATNLVGETAVWGDPLKTDAENAKPADDGGYQGTAEDDHGGFVASIAAGPTGVATGAQVFSVDWLGEIGDFYVNSYADVAAAINASGATVFNASFGRIDYLTTTDDVNFTRDLSSGFYTVTDLDIDEMRAFETLMQTHGMVGVFAVGNQAIVENTVSGEIYLESDVGIADVFYPLLPLINNFSGLIDNAATSSFNFAGVEDKMLSVVSIDASDQIVSQPCGASADWCVAAPGHNVSGILADGRSGTDSGTSFAAPLVSGVAATIKGLFPFMTNVQIVSLIKNTARDLGDSGVDAVYGHGAVDMENALRFQGEGVTVARGGDRVALPSTRAALGSAFGGAALEALSETTIAAVDDYGRAFGFKLGDFVDEARERYDFDAQFNAFMAEQNETDFSVGGFGLNLATGEWEAGKAAPSTIFALATEGGYKLAASYDAPVSARFGLAAEGASSQTDAAMGDSFASPLFSFAEGGLGFSGEIPLGDNGAALAFGMAQGENSAPDSSAEAFASVAEYRHPIGEGSSVRVSLGGLVEENTVLGGETGGALAMADGAPTGFAGVSAQLALGEGFSLIGAYHAGVTIAEPGEGSVYAAIDPLVSDSFSAGLRFDGDRLWGLASVSQPLRVARGSATLALPSSQNADGSLNYAETEADLSPDAREINLQLSGGTETSWGNVMVGGGARLNPNHVADAAPEGLLFFKTTASF